MRETLSDTTTYPNSAIAGLPELPKIAIVNWSTFALLQEVAPEAATESGFHRLVMALNRYVNQNLQDAWGVRAEIWGRFAGMGMKDQNIDWWTIGIVDSYDQLQTLGYHSINVEKGLPMAYVFLKNLKETNQKLAQVVSHEVAEVLIDPGVNLCADTNQGYVVGYEIADPVEDGWFDSLGFRMSNFVHPGWFEPWRLKGHHRLDENWTLQKPFQLSPGGYIPIFKNNQWSHLWGSAEKEAAFKLEDRRGHRSEIRRAPEIAQPPNTYECPENHRPLPG